MARNLRLDEDLAEALALSHDLGHPPFGHAGERALDGEMADYGGFDHNAQSLRVVTKLEARYALFDGLNLTWETLEGLVKHNGPLIGPAGAAKGVDELPFAIRDYNAARNLELDTFAGPEAQVAALADDVAYDAHDIDDGLRSGLLEIDDLRENELTGRILADIDEAHPDLPPSRVQSELIRRLLSTMIFDIADEAGRRLADLGPKDAADIRAAGAPVIAFSDDMQRAERGVKEMLLSKVYRHERVIEVMSAAEEVISNLFRAYLSDAVTPTGLRQTLARSGDAVPEPGAEEVSRPVFAREIADFIAGMTDRYAIEAYRRRFGEMPRLGSATAHGISPGGSLFDAYRDFR